MTPKPQTWAIVIAGFWNRMIFQPQWVARQIYELDEIETLVSLVPSAPVIYRGHGVELRVTDARLQFVAREASDDTLERAESLACKVLQKLDVTPVSAVGINFGYVEQHPSDVLLRSLNFGDDAEIAMQGWEIGSKEIKRALRRADLNLNLTYTLLDGRTVVDLNFHHNVVSASAAHECLQGHVVKRKEDGLALLAETLQLHI